MFKKGSFEIGATIYPVAIKVGASHRSSGALSRQLPRFFSSILCYVGISHQYDPKFGDAFWNSSKYSMVNYLLRMMTSWALVCNVWYLPAMHQKVCLDCAHDMWARVYPERRLILSDFLIKMAGWGKRSAVCQQGEVGHRPPGGATRSPVVKKKPNKKTSTQHLCFKSCVVRSVFFSLCSGVRLQGRRPEESQGEGVLQRGAAEAVQQHGGGGRQQRPQWLSRSQEAASTARLWFCFFVFCFRRTCTPPFVLPVCSHTMNLRVSSGIDFFFLYAVKRGGVSVTQRSCTDCCAAELTEQLSSLGFFGFFFNHCWRY